MSITLNTFPVGTLQCNCTIIYDKKSKEAIIIDPGDEYEKIIKFIMDNNLKLKLLLHTHAHFDHILGTHDIFNNDEKNKFSDVLVALHKEDILLWENIDKQGQMFGINISTEKVKVSHWLSDEEEFYLGETSIKVYFTPGHTPGSCSFYMETSDEPVLFSGDTLFQGSIGRTDLWGGDSTQIIKSIKTRLFTLKDETKVIPGHGTFTNIYNEKKTNPFFK